LKINDCNSYRVDHNFINRIKELHEIYGESYQEIMAIEEMAELTKALIKKLRKKENINDIIEEVADSLICIISLAHLYGYEKVMSIINQKWQRQSERDSLEKYANK